MNDSFIEICGARTHNLKDISIKIPKNKFVAITGASGSGKSSLIFNTLFSYSRKIYLEALSNRIQDKNFVEYDVDYIHGTQPPIAIEQTKQGFSNPRSTVGTFTSIEGYIRIIFSIMGHPVCPVCYKELNSNLYCESCCCYGEALQPEFFSTNHKNGMCLECNGLGKKIKFTEKKIVPDETKSLKWIWENAHNNTFSSPANQKVFYKLCESYGVPVNTPFRDLSAEFKHKFFYGDQTTFAVQINKVINQVKHQGVISYLENQYKNTSSAKRMVALEHYLDEVNCEECQGGRLRKESLHIKINGMSYHDVQKCSLEDLISFLASIEINDHKKIILEKTIGELNSRLLNICQIGLSYLSLNRIINTLSKGELQRLIISQHVSTDITGVLYIMDEPTIGLHEIDTLKLIDQIKYLCSKNASVLVIEHDETLLNQADYIIELGPGGGKNGGEVIAVGSKEELLDNPFSKIFRCFNDRVIKDFTNELTSKEYIEFRNLSKNNVNSATVSFPNNSLICVTGVSGAGKSSIIMAIYEEVLKLQNDRNHHKTNKLKGLEHVVFVDQTPIGVSSRSNTITYTGLYDHIRDLMAGLPRSIELGMDKSCFSLNINGGRCEKCKGLGMVEVDMYFLKNKFIQCEECNGKRFNNDVLGIRLNDKNVYEILELTVEEAKGFFKDLSSKVYKGLELLNSFGLGYLKLGQVTDTFSGGESQRIKLVKELLKGKKEGTLYIFDEPTTGLHIQDVFILNKLFRKLIDQGNTIIVIEHNMDIILSSDFIIDMGPEGGYKGGKVVFNGTVKEFIESEKSITATFLKKHLNKHYSTACSPQ